MVNIKGIDSCGQISVVQNTSRLSVKSYWFFQLDYNRYLKLRAISQPKKFYTLIRWIDEWARKKSKQ